MLRPANRLAQHLPLLLLVAFINSNQDKFSHATTTRFWIGDDPEVIFLADLRVLAQGPQ